ncbi:50S ribosomal protein L9 [Desulfurobacterium thermolithotrophum DSM 11699]|uniref:Large ribosomal subunit protein bL9 n=1 Tax=Desulfurobacterium thermolithotrophum (strain DSM 11699 / BSA) TaxID=868864 RepID=F0S462_DESTD|nr:50S ribosomal protein L9 [Desulfurobacterium thermolithotrophum]ADY73634.1 50S ribosomal protein L9 [Desulfurobacterium thermolithotrophum DSM 11699]
MEVILLRDMENLGKVGDVVRVKDGYARNYLIPEGIALPASKSNIAKVRNELKALQRKAQRQLERYKELAEQLSSTRVVIEHEAGEEGKLFGSVTTSQIEKALHKAGFEDVEKRQIILEKPIRETGSYEVKIHLFKDIEATITVDVVPLNK